MIKCTSLPLRYSRHMLAYENEAVFFTYSYITNSQTTENKAIRKKGTDSSAGSAGIEQGEMVSNYKRGNLDRI